MGGASDGEVTLYRDWDYFASMAESLRIYLFEHGTIPLWNMHFCGGKPELANPQSWAFTWPSLFVYALPAYDALYAMWATLSLIGFFAMTALLRRLGAASWAAAAGALLWTANGYFASRFNQGQATFAFFHLVPLLIYCFIRQSEALRASTRTVRWTLAHLVVSFAFFTAAIPHALFYCYPAYVAFVAVSFAKRRDAALWVGMTTHALGLGLAAYKLVPVALWQATRPRRGVLPETTGPLDVLLNTLRLIPDYSDMSTRYYETQTWFAWEHNAYVGLVPWALVIVCAVLALRSRGAERVSKSEGVAYAAVPWAIILLLLGFALSTGNETMLSPARLFAYVPILQGIRVFGRYQILIVMGLCVLLAVLMTRAEPMAAERLPSPLACVFVKASVVLALCLPAMHQTFILSQAIKQYPDKGILDLLHLAPNTGVPRFAPQDLQLARGGTFQRALIRSGYWPSDCYEPLTVTRLAVPVGETRALSEPAPSAPLRLQTSGLALALPLTDIVTLGVPADPAWTADVPLELNADGRFVAHLTANQTSTISLRRPNEGDLAGLIPSSVALVISVLLIVTLRLGPRCGARRSRR